MFFNGYWVVMVGECLGDLLLNWYCVGLVLLLFLLLLLLVVVFIRIIIFVVLIRMGVSIDGICGNGIICVGIRWGVCCFVFGFCGVGEEYC